MKIVTDLSCYYCNSGDLEHEECNAEEYGELVKCQYVDEKEDHYGNACVVGHTGDLHLIKYSLLNMPINSFLKKCENNLLIILFSIS